MFPVTKVQLAHAIEGYGFNERQARRIVIDLEGEGRLALSGSMVKILHPTDPDAEFLKAICQRARGGSPCGIGTYKLVEYLRHIHSVKDKAGGSRRG